MNDNYQKRGSSERSYADVFGDGPYNNESIDFIAAGIFRIGQKHRNFPDISQSTPHIWKYGDADIEDIKPYVDLEKE